jgi:hypothetical protein
MIEQDVTQLSGLLKIDKDIIVASEKDGTLSTRISDALKKNFTDNSNLETFKKNFRDQARLEYFSELVDGAKKGDIPQELYKPVKGSALQQKEREISKAYNITDFSGFDDLIEKVSKVKTTATGNDSELVKKIEDLKAANLALKQDKENAVKDVESKFKSQFLSKEKLDLISKVPFDFSDVKAEELNNKRQKTWNILESVFDKEFKLDYDDKQRLVVLKNGEVIKNPATLDPKPVSDVMVELAKDYNLKLSSPEKGGQGGSSSSQSGTTFADYEAFESYCKGRQISPTSSEAVKLWKAGRNIK